MISNTKISELAQNKQVIVNRYRINKRKEILLQISSLRQGFYDKTPPKKRGPHAAGPIFTKLENLQKGKPVPQRDKPLKT